MTQWEYTETTWGNLNKLGLEGWELVCVSNSTYYMKRKLKPKPRMEPLPDYGDHMTMEDFLELVENGDLTEDDGCGNYATATEMSGRTVDLDNIKKNEWTHVVWFNK